jgi:hypothetical protein
MAERPFVDKPLVEIVSNVHSESCPRGLTFTAEPTEGAIPGTVPGDRTDDRKAAGNGPGGGSTITSNRGRRCASRRTVGPSGHFAVPGATDAGDHAMRLTALESARHETPSLRQVGVRARSGQGVDDRHTSAYR